jgi:hypothetical protein
MDEICAECLSAYSPKTEGIVVRDADGSHICHLECFVAGRLLRQACVAADNERRTQTWFILQATSITALHLNALFVLTPAQHTPPSPATTAPHDTALFNMIDHLSKLLGKAAGYCPQRTFTAVAELFAAIVRIKTQRPLSRDLVKLFYTQYQAHLPQASKLSATCIKDWCVWLGRQLKILEPHMAAGKARAGHVAGAKRLADAEASHAQSTKRAKHDAALVAGELTDAREHLQAQLSHTVQLQAHIARLTEQVRAAGGAPVKIEE